MNKQMIELKKVVEESETSTIIKEWGNLFLTNIQTQEESTEFMQALTNILVSNITRRRRMISPSYYSEETLGGESVFVRDKKKSGADTVIFDLSVSSALEEIPSQYMRKLYLEILTLDEQVFEYYTIKYEYLAKSSESDFTDMSEIQDSTLTLLKEINHRASVWPMVKAFKIQLRISYYEDVIPPGYTPELFTNGPAPDRRSLPNFRRVLIGHVRTGHHVLRLEAATTRHFRDSSQLNYPQDLIATKKILSDISSNSSTIKLPEENEKVWPIVQTPETDDSSRNISQRSTKKRSNRKRRTQIKRKRKIVEEPPVFKLSKLIEEKSDFERFKLSTILEESTVPSLRTTVEETDDERIQQTPKENTQESYDDEIIPATPPEVKKPHVNRPLNESDSIDLAFAADLSYKKNITPQALKEFFEKEISLSESEFRCYCKFSVREDLFICQHCNTVHHRACYNILPKMDEPKNLCCVNCAYANQNLTCTNPKLMKFMYENELEKLVNYGRYCRLRASLYSKDELRTEELFKNFGIPKDTVGKALSSLLANNAIKPSNVKNVFIVNKIMPH